MTENSNTTDVTDVVFTNFVTENNFTTEDLMNAVLSLK